MSYKKIGQFFSRLTTGQIVYICLGIGLISLIIMVLLYKELDSNNPIQMFFIYLFLFFGGLSGLVIALRREIPKIPLLNGTIAVIYGIFIMIAAWILIVFDMSHRIFP
jgi:glucan phosphoethanolaminetransferase (alkaline phosphatase superfamily)